MTNGEQIEAFVTDVQRVIQRYKDEFNLPVASAIGALEMVKLALWKEQTDDSEDEDEDTAEETPT